MARAKIKVDKSSLTSQLIRQIGELTDTDQLKQEVGLFTTERIRFQTRIGEPLNDTGDFPELAEATVEQRKYLEKFNPTDRTYSPGRANVTFTGQLLDSLGFKKIKNGIELMFLGRRKPYRTGPGSRQRKVPTNAELQEHLEDAGFFVFTKKGIEEDQKFNRQITQIVRRFIRRRLR